VTRHRIILCDSRKETVIQEFQNENYSFKTWINHLPDKELITSSRDILLVPFKYCCNIASTMHYFQNKVLNTTTATSIFPDIVKREKKSEK
jgi:predicted transcriptional regulator